MHDSLAAVGPSGSLLRTRGGKPNAHLQVTHLQVTHLRTRYPECIKRLAGYPPRYRISQSKTHSRFDESVAIYEHTLLFGLLFFIHRPYLNTYSRVIDLASQLESRRGVEGFR
jgi:hypothetical protein